MHNSTRAMHLSLETKMRAKVANIQSTSSHPIVNTHTQQSQAAQTMLPTRDRRNKKECVTKFGADGYVYAHAHTRDMNRETHDRVQTSLEYSAIPT